MSETIAPVAQPEQATPKIKIRKPKQRACDEKDAKGKLCNGHLKRWYDYPKEIEELIYDWNAVSPFQLPHGRKVMLDDETLRDGLQNPSVQDPTIEEKIKILHLMESLQIDSVNIGLPGAGPRAAQHAE